MLKGDKPPSHPTPPPPKNTPVTWSASIRKDNCWRAGTDSTTSKSETAPPHPRQAHSTQSWKGLCAVPYVAPGFRSVTATPGPHCTGHSNTDSQKHGGPQTMPKRETPGSKKTAATSPRTHNGHVRSRKTKPSRNYVPQRTTRQKISDLPNHPPPPRTRRAPQIPPPRARTPTPPGKPPIRETPSRHACGGHGTHIIWDQSKHRRKTTGLLWGLFMPSRGKQLKEVG